MANKKSSKKDLRRIVKRRARNVAVKSALKTYIKKSRQSTAAGEPEEIATTLKVAISALDKAAERGIVHKNQVARRKSRIAKQAAAALKAGGVEPTATATATAAPKPKAAKAATKTAAKPAAKATAEKKPAAKKATKKSEG